MVNLTQRLVLGCAVLAGLTVWLALAARRPLPPPVTLLWPWPWRSRPSWPPPSPSSRSSGPSATSREDTHRIAQGNLEHRSGWTSRDSFGAHCRRAQPHCRPSARPARIGSRTPPDGVPALRRRPPVHLRAHHRHRRQGPHPQVEPGRSENCWARAPPTVWPSPIPPAAAKILSAIRDAMAMQKAVAGEGEAALLPMRYRQGRPQLSPAHHPHARLRWPLAGRRHHP